MYFYQAELLNPSQSHNWSSHQFIFQTLCCISCTYLKMHFAKLEYGTRWSTKIIQLVASFKTGRRAHIKFEWNENDVFQFYKKELLFFYSLSRSVYSISGQLTKIHLILFLHIFFEFFTGKRQIIFNTFLSFWSKLW